MSARFSAFLGCRAFFFSVILSIRIFVIVMVQCRLCIACVGDSKLMRIIVCAYGRDRILRYDELLVHALFAR